MDFKRLLFVAFCSLLTMTCINYFFPPKAAQVEGVRAGDFVSVAAVNEYEDPLITKVSFDGSNQHGLLNVLDVSSDQGSSMQFSEEGGCLTHYSFCKRGSEGQCDDETMHVSYDSVDEKYILPLFIALDNKTPLFYRCIKNEKNYDDGSVRLVYQAHGESAIITKEFVIPKNGYTIDFSLTIEPLDESVQARIFMPAPLQIDEESHQGHGAAFIVNGAQKFVRIDAKKDQNRVSVRPPVIGIQGTYFVNAFIQNYGEFGRRAYFLNSHSGRVFGVIETPRIHEKTTWRASVYMGPKEYDALKSVDTRLVHVLEYGWFSTLTGLLLRLFAWLYTYIKSYGVVIIVLALLIRLVLLPFSYMSKGGIQKREEFTKKYKYINERYKDDPERRAIEQTELMKKYGVLPGGSGCLPILVQLPLFLALQRGLKSSIVLYHEPFSFWIRDLSLPDPYYILPCFTGFIIYMQMSRQLDAKQKFVALIASIVMIAVFSHVASGLVLFIASSTLFGYLQMRFIKF